MSFFHIQTIVRNVKIVELRIMLSLIVGKSMASILIADLIDQFSVKTRMICICREWKQWINRETRISVPCNLICIIIYWKEFSYKSCNLAYALWCDFSHFLWPTSLQIIRIHHSVFYIMGDQSTTVVIGRIDVLIPVNVNGKSNICNI